MALPLVWAGHADLKISGSNEEAQSEIARAALATTPAGVA
jgi:hypothetical protein